MHSTTFNETGIGTAERLRVFVLYVDNPAAAHSNWLRDQLGCMAENGLDFSFEAWNLSSVAGHCPITETIAREAAESDVLVIATTALDQREPELIQWLNLLAPNNGDREGPGLLIGLFGDEKDQAAELDWMVGELVAFSRRRQMGFVWQWMEREALCDNSWLAASLEESCARRPSVINYQLANSTW